MKAFILACVAAIVVAGIAVVSLDTFQRNAGQAYTTTGARI